VAKTILLLMYSKDSRKDSVIRLERPLRLIAWGITLLQT